MTEADAGTPPDRGARVLLAFATVAVAFAAADTYVVVLALPDMMAGVGLSADELQRAAPIVSGFLLGYVAVLPLVGRLADLRGRLPVLLGSLAVFALGSLVTAAAYDLPSMVAGRFLQGVGGGGLVPATLALVADIYPAHRRGVPLGIVGAVQELGSVLGPLYGAVVLAVGSWRSIFWVNLAVGLVLAAALRAVRNEARVARSGTARRCDGWGAALTVLLLACLLLTMLEPDAIARDVTLGLAFVPLVGETRWLAPAGLATAGLLVLLVARCLTARHPLVDLRGWAAVSRRVDAAGAALLSLALGCVIVAFASADPEVQVFSPLGPYLLVVAAVAAAGFWWRNRVARDPLVPRRSLAALPAWGSLVVSFFVGSALIAALVDIPIFARITVHPDSQLAAALVLVRFLVALPVGAVVGGWLTHRAPAGVVTAAGMVLAGVSFWQMSTWGLTTLESAWTTVPLAVAGFGFGLAIAPVNAALLASTALEVHGIASALLVVARMVGMLVGISALTTLGMRQYYAEQADLPAPMDVCGEGVSKCSEFTLILREAGLTELQVIFLGAAVCCALAAVSAVVLFRGAETRAVRSSPLEAGIG
ncbi:MFS transporter [Nocardioides caldifontis]|uniref:MFS transporter n=1 Tax=Nocardioides caldifontis TaxID=2588938 RepID=UPI0011DFDF21|nr:MFS transporter [Nocardioides caldifontis]